MSENDDFGFRRWNRREMQEKDWWNKQVNRYSICLQLRESKWIAKSNFQIVVGKFSGVSVPDAHSAPIRHGVV